MWLWMWQRACALLCFESGTKASTIAAQRYLSDEGVETAGAHSSGTVHCVAWEMPGTVRACAGCADAMISCGEGAPQPRPTRWPGFPGVSSPAGGVCSVGILVGTHRPRGDYCILLQRGGRRVALAGKGVACDIGVNARFRWVPSCRITVYMENSVSLRVRCLRTCSSCGKSGIVVRLKITRPIAELTTGGMAPTISCGHVR